MTTRLKAFAGATGACLALLGAPMAWAFDPAVEAQNYSKGLERQAIYLTPEYQVLLREVSAHNAATAVAIQAADPERNFITQLCARGEDGCAGDARLYDWQAKGYGIVEPVLLTARNGATISGHVWATKAGVAKRPGIVITNGSVQAPETLYWFVAQTLAKAGYYYPSRLDISLSSTRFTCEDLRSGCPGMTPDDGGPAHYDYFSIVTTPDGPARSATVPSNTRGLP